MYCFNMEISAANTLEVGQNHMLAEHDPNVQTDKPALNGTGIT